MDNMTSNRSNTDLLSFYEVSRQMRRHLPRFGGVSWLIFILVARRGRFESCLSHGFVESK